jgi:hypothetical protein
MTFSPVLHLICLDDPSVPDYGGMIDTHFKILAFEQAGVELHLHILHKSKIRNPDWLKAHCASFQTYKRQWLNFAIHKPYFISNRENSRLLRILSTDNLPILFDGLHTSGHLKKLKSLQPERDFFIRIHNFETGYYHNLRIKEKNRLKRFYYFSEEKMLSQFEPNMFRLATGLFPISKNEIKQIESIIPGRAKWIPAFTGSLENFRLNSLSGKADGFTLLYHGNFTVLENVEAAKWLISALFPALSTAMKLILAGKGIPGFLKEGAEKNKQIEIIDSPENMDKILISSDLVILPGWQKEGVKLKLLKTLESGKRVLCMSAVSEGSGLNCRDIHFKNTLELREKIIKALNGELDDVYNTLFQEFFTLYNPLTIANTLKEYIFKE